MHASEITSGSGYILPASIALRAAEFERLCRVVLLMSGTARPLLASTPHNLGPQGQWDGVVSYRGGMYVLEAKAYFKPLGAIPGIEKRLAEAKSAGLSGVIAVSLSGYAGLFSAPDSDIPLISLAFNDLAVGLDPGRWVMPTGDILTADDKGFKLNNGCIEFIALKIQNFRGKMAFLDDRDYLALRRCSLYASAGRSVSLYSVPPFCGWTTEVERLWDIEDRIRGLYAPPLSLLRSIFEGNGKLLLDGLQSRLRKNISKIISNNGSLPIPWDCRTARERIVSYEPFVFWSQLRSANSFNRAVEIARERYLSYRPYCINPFNPNKARACERYLEAAKV